MQKSENRRIIRLFPLHPSESQQVLVIKPSNMEDDEGNASSEIDPECPIGLHNWPEHLSLIEAETLSKALAEAVLLARQVGWTGSELSRFGER
jgi:hypothetical protein